MVLDVRNPNHGSWILKSTLRHVSSDEEQNSEIGMAAESTRGW